MRLLAALLATLAFATSCTVSEQAAEIPQSVIRIEPNSAEDYLTLAETSDPAMAFEYRLSAAELLIQDQQLPRAEAVVNEAVANLPSSDNLDDTLQTRLALVRAELEMANGNPAAALSWLEGELTSNLQRQAPALRQQVTELQARALMATERPGDAVLLLVEFDGYRPSAEIQRSHDIIWQALQYLSDQQLTDLADQAGSYQLRGWIELARSMRAQEYSIPSQLAALERWQTVWNNHDALNRLPTALQQLETVWQRRPRHLALLLPLQQQIGRAVQDGFLSAYYDALKTDGSAPRISVYDTSGATDIQGLYDAAVASGAELVIGPLNKELVRQLGNLADLPVPTLALNYTDFETPASESLYQFGLAPEDEIRQAAKRAWGAGYRNAAVVAPDSPDYARLQQAFADIWEALGGNVVSAVNYRADGDYGETIQQLLAIDASEDRAARLRALLPRGDIFFTPRRRQDIDFIFLMANPRQGRQIKPTLAFYFAEDIPVYALPAIYDGGSNQLVNQDLNGVIFTDTPWLLGQNPLKELITETLRPSQGALQRLQALGVDSFRLHSRLTQLTNGQISNFRGATGLLSLQQGGVIQRVPQTAVFADGRAVPLESSERLALD